MSSLDEDRHDPSQFVDCLPEEAMLMSSCGTAHGYDVFRYGEQWLRDGNDPGGPIAQISEKGVQILVMSDAQVAWINDPGVSGEARARRAEARRTMVLGFNFTNWGELSEENREYLLSLHWIPDKALSAMEIIAKMSDT